MPGISLAWCRQEFPGVKAMVDNDTYLMVEIFRKVFEFEGTDAPTTAAYLKEYGFHITKLGELFDYLGLAQLDTECALGWKPTHLMMDVIAKRVFTQRPHSARGGSPFMWQLLHDAVYGDQEVNTLVVTALLALGLLRENSWFELVATRQLEELFCEAYRDRGEERERARRMDKKMALPNK
jgi:hypothetical protein